MATCVVGTVYKYLNKIYILELVKYSEKNVYHIINVILKIGIQMNQTVNQHLQAFFVFIWLRTSEELRRGELYTGISPGNASPLLSLALRKFGIGIKSLIFPGTKISGI